MSLKHTSLDRARDADLEYHLFIAFWSSFGEKMLKIRGSSKKVKKWHFLTKLEISATCTAYFYFRLFYSDSASKSEYNHICLSIFHRPHMPEQHELSSFIDALAPSYRKRIKSFFSNGISNYNTSFESPFKSEQKYALV